MKKGFFFSLMTFLLLFSIIIFSADYISRSKQLQNSLADSRLANRMVYIEDDITDGAIEGLSGIRINSITRNTSKIILNFTGGMIGYSNTALSIARYESFITNNYSAISNLGINISNLTAGFMVEPFGSSYLAGPSKSTFTTSNYTAISNIRVIIDTNISIDRLTMSATPADTGDAEDTELTVVVRDIAGNSMLADPGAVLDPALSNDAFRLVFTKGEKLEVRFGNYEGRPGSLILNQTGIAASVTEITIYYDLTQEQVIVKNGQLKIYSAVDGMSKQGDIVLKRG